MAGALEGWPALKGLAKWGYQRLAYALQRRPDSHIELHPSVTISGILPNPAADPPTEAFFGYYDKSPWSWDGNFYLTHLCRSPETAEIGWYEPKTASLKVIGRTEAFNCQQGAMLSWLPGHQDLCLFNDYQDGLLVARIVNVTSGKQMHLAPMPIQTLHPSGRQALTLNYRRLALLRPEYGYRWPAKNFPADLNNAHDGIWRLILPSNEVDLLLSLAELAAVNPHPSMNKALHKVNHLLYNPSGFRFAFLHRWLGPQGKFSRLYTADSSDGDHLYCLADERLVSHYAWLDDNHLLAWARKTPYGDRYFLLRDRSDSYTIIADGILDIYGDGHPSFSPDRRWLVTDTYPDKARRRHLLLFNLKTQELVLVGSFFAPWRYDGERRCDLHPRWHPDGTKISIDSTHEGFRNTYLIDVAGIVSHA